MAACLGAASALGCLYDALGPAKTGIVWRHDNALSPRRYLPESIGPGVAVLDYDNDGWMDLYFVNSGPCDFFSPARPPRNALYRNNRDGTFTDVTEKAGVAGRGFGLGAFAADYNQDGFPDLLVTSYGSPILYRNNGDATFTDVTKPAGLDVSGLWTAAVFFDYDNDGKLDLYLGHFVKYTKALERECKTADVYHYCYPLSYDPRPSRLYHNNGDGTFSNASEPTGIGRHSGKTFGAVATDINNDGWLDLFVANDSVQNFLFLNKGGKFQEIALEAEVAYNADGAARSGMGVDAADYDGDGLEDLFVANFNGEKFSLYRNRGDLTFADVSGPGGIAIATHMYSGWGARFYDFDHDGDLDLIVANGHPDDQIEAVSGTWKHKEPLLLFENRGAKFSLLGPATAGKAFAGAYPARGLAVADLDNDGYADLVVANNGEPPLILRHRGGRNGWIGLKLEGQPSGARITWQAGGLRRSRLIRAGGSYLSSSDPRELLGLGSARQADWVEVRWPRPSRRIDRFQNVAAGRYYTLNEGRKLR